MQASSSSIGGFHSPGGTRGIFHPGLKRPIGLSCIAGVEGLYRMIGEQLGHVSAHSPMMGPAMSVLSSQFDTLHHVVPHHGSRGVMHGDLWVVRVHMCVFAHGRACCVCAIVLA